MENLTNQNERLIIFLRNLADAIEKGELVPRQLQSIGEFFMAYQFQEVANEDPFKQQETEEFDQEELIKFLIIGWYIYRIILREKTIPNVTNEFEVE